MTKYKTITLILSAIILASSVLAFAVSPAGVIAAPLSAPTHYLGANLGSFTQFNSGFTGANFGNQNFVAGDEIVGFIADVGRNNSEVVAIDTLGNFATSGGSNSLFWSVEDSDGVVCIVNDLTHGIDITDICDELAPGARQMFASAVVDSGDTLDITFKCWADGAGATCHVNDLQFVYWGEVATATPTPTNTAGPTFTPSHTPTPTLTPTPGGGGGGGDDVWQIGNYIEDDSFEGINWFDDLFFARWKSFAFGTASAEGALCGNKYSEFKAAQLIGGETYSTQSVGVSQKVLWWGGDMYVSFGYRTSGDGSASAYLIDPFNRRIPIASNLVSDGEWTVFYDVVADQLLGKYTLVLQGNAVSFSDKVHFDAVSVSEATYVHCTYLSAPNFPPPAASAQTSITDPGTESTEAIAPGWITAGDNAAVYGTGSAMVLGLFGPAVGADDVLDPIWVNGIDDAFAKSEDWIDVLEDELNARKGYLPEKSYATLSHALAVNYIINDLSNDIVALENVETGEIHTAAGNCIQHGSFEGFFEGYACSSVYELQPGRYRIRVGFDGTFTETVYISRVCVAAAEFIITTQTCDGLYFPPVVFENATLDAMAAQVTARAGTTETAAAAAVGTQQAIFAATATPRAATTQTALAAGGNTTAIARATLTQVYALTRTPQIAISRTAFVNQWRASLTAAAGGTATARAQYATSLAQGSLNATAQAQTLRTAYAQATNSAQLTAIVHHQATISSAATQQVQNQPTVIVIVDNGAATAAAAATALAAAPANATLQAQATAAAQQLALLQAQATAYANLQSTLIAQLTAQPNSNATLQAQATLIQQQQQTLIATLQALATQQVLQMPVDQPMPEEMDPDLGCSRPDNPINIPAWIDYEFCRLLWYITWNETNTRQTLAIATQVGNFEPFGTIAEVGSLVEDVDTQVQQYDWIDTGFEGSDDPIPNIIADPNGGNENVITFIPNVEDVPLFTGEFSFDNAPLGFVFSTTCETKLEDNLGPYLTPPLCFLMDITRRTGWLPFMRLLFDLGAILMLVRYYWGWFLDLAGENAKAVLREPTPGQTPPPGFSSRRP